MAVFMALSCPQTGGVFDIDGRIRGHEVRLSMHDGMNDTVSSPYQVGYSTLMDAFIVTKRVFLCMVVLMTLSCPQTGGVFDIDGRIRGHEPGVPGHDGGHPHLRVPPPRRLRIQGLHHHLS